jgi:UDPglucose 6-dehydrogenase
MAQTNMKRIRYSIVGLGKLGASMAAAIASRGFEVIGVDVNATVVDAINAGRAPVSETGLADAVEINRDRLRATVSHSEAIAQSDVTFVIVPTPSDRTGMFSLQYASFAFREIGSGLARKDDYHLVVVPTSTVVPGLIRQVLLPQVEAASGKKCGRDFGICDNPEFIALGSVIREFLNPDTYKIVYANMLAEFCERIPGGDVDVVCDALGADRRIGRRYLTGGLGFGGPCFPRYNIALSAFGRHVGAGADIAVTTDAVNAVPLRRLVNLVGGVSRPESTVAVLGLAYKPKSHVIERSQGLEAALAIAALGTRVICYDPLARNNARNELKDKALVFDNMKACLDQADIVVIANADPEFARLTSEDFPQRSPPSFR